MMVKYICMIVVSLLLTSSLASAQTVGVRGTAKGTSTPLGVTSTAANPNHTGLDVTIVGVEGGAGADVVSTQLASSVTTNTTSAAVALPVGYKTIYGQVVGTGSVAQTQAIYGDIDNDAANGVLLCTLTLSGTTRAQDACPVITANFSYYYVVTTATSGTSATGAVYAMY